MDGNGRWAQARGLERTEGHAAGEEALFDAIEGAKAIGVKWLTVFAFSTENWKRPPEEVKFLMNFNESLLERRSHELNDMGIRIRFAGRRNWRVPKRVLRRMDEAVELTKNNREMTLTIAFNYGGRAEIIDAVKQMLEDGVAIDRITERKLERYLYSQRCPTWTFDQDLRSIDSSCYGRWRTANCCLLTHCG